ncbi:O-antigen ligase family protein [Microbacterium sp. W1N]|uniref:O-antigen ligase family protein n=1 Tax=Microbacterium festucae TaxID=2977531 RepID=UPI0021BE30B1|nr:O-antigen ligase family protein [Microbacterium festucae]MCT9818747.1 O-antigen ligase family protein [Microbacterium festucae]
MTVHTKHPVAAPPVAPRREKTGHLLLRGWCIFVLAAGLAGTAWLLAFGTAVSAVVAVGSALVSITLWLVLRPAVQWRRLPWFAVGYVALATSSLIWSAWPAATGLTLVLLVSTSVQAMFVAAVLTWRELVRTLASALKWIIGLSIVFELWVSLVWGGPILPLFERPDGPVEDPIVLWSRDNLFDGGRIQGIFGNANALAYVALLAATVFAVRIAARAPRRTLLWVWIALAAYLFVRAGSATAYLSAAFTVVVLVAALLMRTTRRPGARTKYYLSYAAVAIGGLTALWLLRDTIFGLLGRSSDLTGREGIWALVAERAAERPVLGWGFSTPWVPSDPAFDRWIVDHGQTVMQAHNMWLDVFLQLGVIGLVVLGLTYLAFIWRAWFFAVDRPRWDLDADRPYSPLTLVPTLVAAQLLIQGLAESSPLLGWGWLLLVMFAFKIKQAPLIGRGPSEERLAGERGEQLPANGS